MKKIPSNNFFIPIDTEFNPRLDYNDRSYSYKAGESQYVGTVCAPNDLIRNACMMNLN